MVREAEGSSKCRRAVQAGPRVPGPTLRQLIFNWKAQDKYNEFYNFKIEVRNISLTNGYNIKENEKVLIIIY